MKQIIVDHMKERRNEESSQKVVAEQQKSDWEHKLQSWTHFDRNLQCYGS